MTEQLYMDYEMFLNGVMRYKKLYSDGMKHAANGLMQDLCRSLEALPPDDRDMILAQFTQNVCETEEMTFLFNRGNGQMPFQLMGAVRSWLYPRCRQHRMPELRWFYQIFNGDRDNSVLAYAFLDEAYAHADVDNLTQKLVFERNVNSLEYGLHELPIGLLITAEDADIIFRQCNEIIKNGNISSQLIEKFISLKEDYVRYTEKNL